MMQRINVNVASSYYCEKGFVNLDNHLFMKFLWCPRLFRWLFPKKYHDVYNKFLHCKENFIFQRHDCRTSLPFVDESVDHILCAHFLEHLYFSEAIEVLKDYYQKLKIGGTLHISMPDMDHYVSQYQKNRLAYPKISCDSVNLATLLTSSERPSKKFSFLEFCGGFGLKHHYVWNKDLCEHVCKGVGFSLAREGTVNPSSHYRTEKDAFEVFLQKNG